MTGAETAARAVLCSGGLREGLPDGWVTERETGGVRADDRRLREGSEVHAVRVEWDRGRFWAAYERRDNLRGVMVDVESGEFGTAEEAARAAARWTREAAE